ncbi:MAG TPA: ATP-binding cassette domain-containing protein, partial [Rectinemataceae bacterium]|nr:ATP-binding cassette domain-containing protein [Rectinemataceae bacterium]
MTHAEDRLLAVRDLSVEYLTPGAAARPKGRASGGAPDQPAPSGTVRAVNHVSFELSRGEVLGLAGESGSGKSTTAHAILRILRPPALIVGGQVLFGNRDTLAMSETELGLFRWKEVAIVFQSAMNSLNPVMRIRDQLLDVMLRHGLSRDEAQDRARRLLDLVGIEPARLDAYPHQLSGGMRQRA